MDVIHSLQLILSGSLSDKPVDDSKVIVKAPSVDDRIQRADELRIVTNEMLILLEMILLSDEGHAHIGIAGCREEKY
ncbi:hypothetical protein ACFX1Z_024158 [Malus domestica]